MTLKTDLEVKDYEVFHRLRPVKFRGVLLASSSSDDENARKLRWFEVSVYRTEGGAYIAARVGRSRVYHRDRNDRGCEVADGDRIQAKDLDEDEIPCPRCRPVDLDGIYDDEWVIAETDRPTVEIHDTGTPQERAAALVKSLYVRDRPRPGVELEIGEDGEPIYRYRLPKPAERALERAGLHDDAIKEAFSTAMFVA